MDPQKPSRRRKFVPAALAAGLTLAMTGMATAAPPEFKLATGFTWHF
jgi:hypothetical protein